MPEDLFEEVEEEGESTNLDDLGENTPAESLTEKKQAVEPQEGEENTLDEKQPTEKERWRWMQMRKANRELKESQAAMRAEIESIKASKQESPNTVELPQDWIQLYGDNPQTRVAYQKYLANNQAEIEKMEAKILERIESKQQSELKGSQEAQTYIDQEIEDMKGDGLQFETNELMKFIVEFQKEFGAGSLLDNKGNYDLRKSLNLMQRIQPPQTNNSTDIKKKVAGNLLKTKVGGKESIIPSISRNVLRRGSWRDAI